MPHTLKIDMDNDRVEFFNENVEYGPRMIFDPSEFVLQTTFDALDHGADLAGLNDDDHTQYLLANGTRALAGNWDIGGYNLPNIGKLAVGSATVDGTYAALIKGNNALKVQSAAADIATFDSTGHTFGVDLNMDGNNLTNAGEVNNVTKLAIGTATVDGTYAALIKSANPLKFLHSGGVGTATWIIDAASKVILDAAGGLDLSDRNLVNVGTINLNRTGSSGHPIECQAASGDLSIRVWDSTGVGEMRIGANSSGYGYLVSSSTGNRLYFSNSNGVEVYHGTQDRFRSTRASGILYFEAPSEIWLSTNWAQQYKFKATGMTASGKAEFNITTATDTIETVFQCMRQRTGGGAGVNFGAAFKWNMHNSTNGWKEACAIDGYWTDPTAGSEDSNLQFAVEQNGSWVRPLKVRGADDSCLITNLEIDNDLNHDGSNVGFYGVTPAARPTAYTQTYSTATKTHNNITSSAVTWLATSGGYGASSAAEFDSFGNAINAIRTDVANIKQVLNQVIDDLQTLGLLQ